jgi:hypothetical protein
MLTTLLSGISLKGILYAVAAIVLGIGIYAGISFIKAYGTLKQNNATLQQTITTAQLALTEQKTAAAKQQQVASDTLTAVQQQNATAASALVQSNANLTALLALRKPTSADVACVNSPYVSTIFSRLRQQRSPTPAANHHQTGNASAAR